MLSEDHDKTRSNSPVTFVTQEHFTVLLRKLTKNENFHVPYVKYNHRKLISPTFQWFNSMTSSNRSSGYYTSTRSRLKLTNENVV